MKRQIKQWMTFSTLVLGACSAIQAAPPYSPDLTSNGNRWEATGYLDSSPLHIQANTQGFCFYPDGVIGTHQMYVWVSDTFPGWDGRAAQEGDQIFMFGDFPILNSDGSEKADIGHDGIEWEIVTMTRSNEGAGHVQEWIEDANFGMITGFGNVKFQRVGKCKYDTAEQALAANRRLQRPIDKLGNYAVSPMGMFGNMAE